MSLYISEEALSTTFSASQKTELLLMQVFSNRSSKHQNTKTHEFSSAYNGIVFSISKRP